MPAQTQCRDLHDGRPLWQDRPVRLPPRQRISRDRSCDVLIVGAGISGAMLADSLSEAGLHVIICDRREPLQGSTLASTAMILHEIDTPLARLANRMPRADAERIWRRSYLAVQALRERIRVLGIEAEVAEQDSLYLQGDVLDAEGLRDEAKARCRAGLDARYLSAGQVAEQFGIRRRTALCSSGALAANPRALAAGFLRAAVGRGAELFAPEEVTQVQPRRGSVEAITNHGRRILARHLVFATGYELPKHVPKDRYRIASTWAIATPPQPRRPWPGNCMIWEASSPYLYLRTTADRRVICGGGDEDIADAARRDALLGRKSAWLQRRLSALLPGINLHIDYAWGGCFGLTRNGLPVIGEVPGLRRCYAVMGFGGNGITFSMMAAQMLRNELTGTGDADLDLVAFRSSN